MSALTVTELLARFTASRCGEAFREVVQRYSGFVKAVALRQTAGDAAAAEDLVQEVFTGLARESRRVHGETLGAWLHRRTVFVASNWRRGEMRRRKREAAAVAESQEASVRAVPEGFDEAFSRLREADQQLLFWHYMEDEDYRSIGARLGISDDAAQKRTARALEQLRASLVKSGAIPAGTALTAVLVAAAGSEPVSAAQQIQWAATATEAAAQTKWAAAGFLLPAACLVAGVALPIAFPESPDSPVPPPPKFVEAAGYPSPPPGRAPEPPGVQTDLAGLLIAAQKAQASPLWAARLDRTICRFTAAQCRSTIEELGYKRPTGPTTPAQQTSLWLHDRLVARWANADPLDAVQTLERWAKRDGQPQGPDDLVGAYYALGARDIAAAERELAAAGRKIADEERRLAAARRESAAVERETARFGPNLAPRNSPRNGRSGFGGPWVAAIRGFGTQDFDAALALWRLRLMPSYSEHMEEEIWEALAFTNPAVAARKLAEMGGPLEALSRGHALANLAESDPGLARRMLQEKPVRTEDRGMVANSIFRRFQATEPSLAVRHGAELLGDRAIELCDNELIGSLATFSYAKAWPEIVKAPPGAWREALERKFGRQFAWDRPKEALAKFRADDPVTGGLWWKALQSLASMNAEAALAVPVPPNAMPDSIEVVAATLAVKDPAVAAKWLAALPRSFEKEAQRARGALSVQLHRRNPQAAAALVQTLKGDARLAALTGIAEATQVRSPSQLASTLKMLSEVFASQQLMTQKNAANLRKFSETWSRDDPLAASAWLTALPRGPAFDHAAAGLAKAVRDSDPPESLAWASAINDDTTRVQAASKLIQDWSMADNAECEAAIEALDAPQAVKAGFLQFMHPESQ